MSNGTRIRYEHIEDDSQVPRSPDVTENPSAHYIALARLQPTLEWQKMSMADLLVYLNTALSFDGQLVALERRFNVVIGEVRTVEGKNTQQDAAIRNVEGLLAGLQRSLNSLEGKLNDLATGGAGTGPTTHTRRPGVLRYGVRTHDDTVRGTAQEAHYTDLPFAVPITFPSATAENDEWFFQIPIDTRVTHITNAGPLGRIDELGSGLWVQGPEPRTWAFTGGLTPQATGDYQIGLERVPVSGTVTFGLRQHDDSPQGDVHDKEYADLPARVVITFPPAVAATDKLFFTVPARASVSSIQTTETSAVVTGDWTYDATTRTWAFTTGLTVGVATGITISLVEETGG